MPTEDIQTEHPEPDSLSGPGLSNTSRIPELWISTPHSCHLHLQDDRWAEVINDSVEDRFWQMIAGIPEIEDGQVLNLGFIWTDADHITSLNHNFRDKDKPTNVLSFPDGDRDPETGEIYLGDVFLCWDVMSDEAAEQHVSLQHHTLHLMLHGVLHLLGYDHILPNEANEMESLEAQLLAKVGIANPYAEISMPNEVIS